jgi:alanine dehydrogenase
MHKIGLLKEIKNFESRVGLSPDGVQYLIESGLDVFVESGAGVECGFLDEHYSGSGATIVPSAEKLVKNADLLVKVLPLSPVEEEMIDNSHIVFSFLKLAPKIERLKSLIDKKFTYFAADLLEDQKGVYTVLAAMSEIAGRMAVHVAANLLSSTYGGRGLLMSGANETPPANVTILGSGLVGRVAAVHSWTNGANVNILTLKPQNIGKYNIKRDGLQIDGFSKEKLTELLPKTDVLMVAIYSLKKTPENFLIDKEDIKLLQPGSIIIDLSVDRNQVVESSHITNIQQPTFVLDDIVHYCVPNITSTVPVTSSKIYTIKILPFIEILAKDGLKRAMDKSPELLSALAIYKGKITNRLVADRFDFTFHNIFDLLELNL